MGQNHGPSKMTPPSRTKQCYIKTYPSTLTLTLIKRDATRRSPAWRNLMNIIGWWWHRHESQKNVLCWWKWGSIKGCKCLCSGYGPITCAGGQFHYIMPALAPLLRTSCFINITDSTSLQSGFLANTSLRRPARFFVQSTNIPGHLLFSGKKGLSNLLLLVQEMVLKPSLYAREP